MAHPAASAILPTIMTDIYERYALAAAEAFSAANREQDRAKAHALRLEAYSYVDLLQALRQACLARAD